MKCSHARRRLELSGWQYSAYCRDRELTEHLAACLQCAALVRAEEEIAGELQTLKVSQPDSELSIDMLRNRARHAQAGADWQKKHAASSSRSSFAAARPRLAVLAAAVVIAALALIPFNFRQQVGYEIAIAGVGKDVALNYDKANSLLDALGMEKDEATNLLDSLGVSQIQFSVGECSETCRLTISDLKTERDVRLMVKAIVDLGCCQIDNIAPIFRSESTSLLRLAARKLLS